MCSCHVPYPRAFRDYRCYLSSAVMGAMRRLIILTAQANFANQGCQAMTQARDTCIYSADLDATSCSFPLETMHLRMYSDNNGASTLQHARPIRNLMTEIKISPRGDSSHAAFCYVLQRVLGYPEPPFSLNWEVLPSPLSTIY